MPNLSTQTQKTAARAHTRSKLTSPFLVCPTQGSLTSPRTPPPCPRCSWWMTSVGPQDSPMPCV